VPELFFSCSLHTAEGSVNMFTALQAGTDEKGYGKSTHMLLRVCLLSGKPLQ